MHRHSVATSTGIHSFLGTSQLSQLLGVPRGCKVKIVFTGEKVIQGGRRVKTFSIGLERSAVIEMAARAAKGLATSQQPLLEPTIVDATLVDPETGEML